jgi:hypothetical protein
VVVRSAPEAGKICPQVAGVNEKEAAELWGLRRLSSHEGAFAILTPTNAWAVTSSNRPSGCGLYTTATPTSTHISLYSWARSIKPLDLTSLAANAAPPHLKLPRIANGNEPPPAIALNKKIRKGSIQSLPGGLSSI